MIVPIREYVFDVDTLIGMILTLEYGKISIWSKIAKICLSYFGRKIGPY